MDEGSRAPAGPQGAPRVDRRAWALLSGLAFVLLLGYEVARTSIDALYLRTFGSDGLPWAWLSVVAGVGFAVVAYNRVARGADLIRLMQLVLAASAAGLVLLVALQGLEPRATVLLLYVWKDVHVVFLVEVLWSIANHVFPTSEARRAYGIFCASGSVGGILGALAVARVEALAGTGAVLAASLGTFVLGAVLVRRLPAHIGRPGPTPPGGSAQVAHRSAPAARGAPSSSAPPEEVARASVRSRALRGSAYLAPLLALVAATQATILFTDFQYNASLERALAPGEVSRMMGWVNASVGGASLLLQLATRWIVRAVGVAAILVTVPLVVSAFGLWFVAAPSLLAIALARIAAKALDYSVFRAAKEMLYIPLAYAERTRGKAIIDVLTYRATKGAASAVLVVGPALGVLVPAVPAAVLFSIAGAALALLIGRRYRRLVPRAAERA